MAGTIQNAYRGFVLIWNYFSQKYLGRPYSPHDSLKLQYEVWDLFDGNMLSDDEKIILGTTYDYVLVKKKNIQRVVDAFCTLSNEEICRVINFESVNSSLAEQSEILQGLLDDEDCIAVGWHQLTSSSDMWENYNCLTGKKHWFLFEDGDKRDRQ